MVWLNVGWRPCEQQAVERSQQLRRLCGHFECWQDHRNAGKPGGFDVFIARRVGRVLAQLLAACGDTDQREARHREILCEIKQPGSADLPIRQR